MKCSECDREIVPDEPYGYKHTDGRVKHSARAKEEDMAPNTRVVPQDGEPYTPTVEARENLVPEAMEVFADMEPELGDIEPVSVPGEEVAEEIAEETGEKEKTEVEKPMFGRPTREKMITVRGGGKYLKARDRINWMRGEPEQHPDWTIDTMPEEIVRGTLK